MTGTSIDIELFLQEYIVAALWSSNDESNERGGNPLDDNYTADDLATGVVDQMRAECQAFIDANLADLNTWDHPRYSVEEMGAHDFWLTRNHHGAGFWDGDWEDEVGARLTEAAHAAGQRSLYVGDDGKIYMMNG